MATYNGFVSVLLTLYQRTIHVFELIQIENSNRQQNISKSEVEIWFGKGENKEMNLGRAMRKSHHFALALHFFLITGNG